MLCTQLIFTYNLPPPPKQKILDETMASPVPTSNSGHLQPLNKLVVVRPSPPRTLAADHVVVRPS